MSRRLIDALSLRGTGQQLIVLAIAVAVVLTPLGTRAQGATPEAGGEPTALAAMLAKVPASLPGLDEPAQATIAYADIEAQLAAVGVTPPDRADAEGIEQWRAATRGLHLPSGASMYDNAWRDDYGFDLLQTDQTISIVLPPYELTFFTGRFDHDAVLQHLDALGYQQVEVDGHDMLSIRGDYEQDFNAPTTYKMAGMNYAVILDDGTLAFASAGAPLAAVLDVAGGERASLMDQAGVATLVANAPRDLATAMLLHGTMLATGVPASLLEIGSGETPDVSAIATEIAETSTMPPIAMALLGATTGGPLVSADQPLPTPPGTPDARAVAVLLMLSPDAAETAATVVEERLATGSSTHYERPYAELFPERVVQVVPATAVLLVELTLGPDAPRNVLTQLLYSRDLGFLGW